MHAALGSFLCFRYMTLILMASYRVTSRQKLSHTGVKFTRLIKCYKRQIIKLLFIVHVLKRGYTLILVKSVPVKISRDASLDISTLNVHQYQRNIFFDACVLVYNLSSLPHSGMGRP